MSAFTLLKFPTTVDIAYAEREVRQRIIDAYDDARTKAERETARRDAIEYDLANPGVSRLVDELDHYPAQAA